MKRCQNKSAYQGLLATYSIMFALCLASPAHAEGTATGQPHARKSANYNFSFQPLKPADIARNGRSIRFDAEDDYSGLPRAHGYEHVAAYCSGCHSLEIVMQQRADKGRWADMLQWMQAKQGMAEIMQEDEAIILAYLAEYFGR